MIRKVTVSSNMNGKQLAMKIDDVQYLIIIYTRIHVYNNINNV